MAARWIRRRLTERSDGQRSRRGVDPILGSISTLVSRGRRRRRLQVFTFHGFWCCLLVLVCLAGKPDELQ